MADIATLGDLKPIEPIDLDEYADSKDFPPLPKKGRYTVRAPENLPFPDAFSRTKAGALSAQVDPTIVGPTSENYVLRFTKVSAKEWKRNGITVSQFADYLRANGIRGKMHSEQMLIDAAQQTVNNLYEVDVDWRAYCKYDGMIVEGMERFLTDSNGGHLPYYPHPTLKVDENGEILPAGIEGEPLMLRANAVVTRYVPAGTGR